MQPVSLLFHDVFLERPDESGFVSPAADRYKLPLRDFEAQLASAWRVVGVYETASGRQVGFARAVSDGVAFAYLADVFILPDARGAGLGKELVATMIDRGPGASFRWTLHTADAHGLYQQYGFAAPDETYLERPRSHAPAGRRGLPGLRGPGLTPRPRA